ncbi:MAG: signal peptidase I [Lachnospiraceae bacterium]|nr:signal peptidase I [Lachnospiraceae bacterium]
MIRRLAALAFVCALAVFTARFLLYPFPVQGRSMEPAAKAGDVVLVNRIRYRLSDPARGDVVLFARPDGVRSLKRIIGLPGETVQISGGQILIDGKVLFSGSDPLTVSFAGRAADPVRLGEDEYFLLGDRDDSSEDSRNARVGAARRSDLVGKAWFVLWPPDDFGMMAGRRLRLR